MPSVSTETPILSFAAFMIMTRKKATAVAGAGACNLLCRFQYGSRLSRTRESGLQAQASLLPVMLEQRAGVITQSDTDKLVGWILARKGIPRGRSGVSRICREQ